MRITRIGFNPMIILLWVYKYYDWCNRLQTAERAPRGQAGHAFRPRKPSSKRILVRKITKRNEMGSAKPPYIAFTLVYWNKAVFDSKLRRFNELYLELHSYFDIFRFYILEPSHYRRSIVEFHNANDIRTVL